MFLLKRIESAYMSRYGVTSVEHGDSDTLFSNLVTSVAAVKAVNSTSVEMSNITTNFQKFEDSQGIEYRKFYAM